MNAQPAIARLGNVISRHACATAFLIYALVAGVYAAATDGVIRDDAYIFFTYARSFSEHGRLAFNPGETSYGVTSIAWTVLLAIGTWLWKNPVAVAKLLGILLGAGGAVLWARWFLWGDRPGLLITAVAIAAVVPNIGADRMVTGMESALLCFLTGALAFSLESRVSIRHYLIGGLCGLCILCRPEMAVVAIALFVYLWRTDAPIAAIKTTAVSALVSGWWYLWLYHATGSLIPPTRTGKLSVFLPEHLGITVGQFNDGTVLDRIGWGTTAVRQFSFSGISEATLIALLLAGLVASLLAARRINRSQSVRLLLPPILALALLATYCWSLPLLQLRYFEWLVPPLVIAGMVSTQSLVSRRWFALGAIAVLAACLLAQPFALARRIDSTRVQQVRRQVGEALQQATPIGSRIALEPIGEIGYYADRYIVDMGGITDTRIQPYLRGGYLAVDSIRRCLQDFNADYLVTYDHDGFLGRLPRAYPEMFELVTYIPSEPVRDTRYRLLKIR